MKRDETRILYVTTGILLEKLIKSRQMREFTHYIIDEIHEREQDMDFVLIVVRKFLNTTSKEARVWDVFFNCCCFVISALI